MAKSTRKTTNNVLTMPTPVKAQSANPVGSEIAKRAYELYCEQGCQDGYDVEHWLQAERELRETASSSAA